MMYDLTGLESSSLDLATWLTNGAGSAAAAWANLLTTLEICEGTLDTLDDVCPQNTDRSVVKVILGLCDDPGLGACYLATGRI